MSKSVNQKLKLLFLIRILEEKTDDEHGITLTEIISQLSLYGITAERKSIYSDIQLLNNAGYEILSSRTGKSHDYRLVGGRNYQLAEVKLMVDAIQSTRFITHKKTAELIKKLEKEVSVNQAKELQRSVYIEKRSKSDNETIYYCIDKIHRAIQNRKQISFNYYEWIVTNTVPYTAISQPKKDGKLYILSPWCMVWDDEKYYLIAYDSEAEKIKHYRVDKIKNVEILDDDCCGEDAFKDFELSTYVKRTFGMFGAKTAQEVKFIIPDYLISPVIDKFGTDYILKRIDDNKCEITVQVHISPQFYGWLFGLGEDVVLTSPEHIVKDFRKMVKRIGKNYKKS